MLSLTLGFEAFAAKRRKAQTDLEARLAAAVREALDGGGWNDVVKLATDLLREQYAEETGTTLEPVPAMWMSQIKRTLEKGDPAVSTGNTIALWLATSILTEAAVLAARDDPEDVFLEWVDMDDKAVRETHRQAAGQVRPAGERFDVGGASMIGPGDVSAPVAEWINCRCTLRPTLASETLTAAGGTVTTTEAEAPTRELYDDALGVPWYGVWAVEDIWTGDKRKFSKGSLSHRPLPLPLTWQKVGDDGHKGHVTVAMAEHGFVEDGKFHAAGRFLMTVPEADEAIGLMAEFGRFGVSVDADDTTMEVDEDAGGVEFTAARVSSACILPIPAFAEAWVALGKAPWLDKRKPGEDEEKPPEADVPEEDMLKPDNEIPTTPDGAPAIKDEAPVEEEDPKKRKRGAVPDPAMAASLAEMVARVHATPAARAQFVDVAPGRTEDGPGWLTNPVDTDRIRDYWVSGPGAAKINWGVPGDFNRCRAMVAQYVKPQHINGYCANRHYDALGFWPGRAPSEQGAESAPFAAETLQTHDQPGPALSLVASVGHRAPAAWFEEPKFAMGDGRVIQVRGERDGRAPAFACPLTVTDEGQVYGHLAAWGMCHLNSELSDIGGCIEPPRSMTDYAYFLDGGVVRLDNGVDVPVGQISLGGGHAADGISMRAALAHYDSTSTAVADINVGEDEFGIWCAGWIRPGTSKEMVTALMASSVSPDWREAKGNLEMIAALAVNVGGFGMPRPRASVRNRRQVSLVASGVIAPSEESVDKADAGMAEMGVINYDALAIRIALELSGIEQRKAAMAALRERVNL